MKNETKSIISRQSCAKELTHNLIRQMIMMISLTIAMLAMTFVFYALPAGSNAPDYVFWILMPISCVLDAIVLGMWIRVIVKYSAYKNGKFLIVEDTLVAMAEEERIRSHGRHVHVTIEKVFYFEEYGRSLASNSSFQYSNVGDRFYVVLDEKRPRVLLNYNTRIYDYRP